MKSTTLNTKRLVWIVAVAGLCVTLFAFGQKQQKQKTPLPQTNSDTIPKKKELKVRDLDEALDEMDRAEIEVNMEQLNAELSKIGPQIKKELANVKIEMEKAMREVDRAEISEKVNMALEKIDCEKINEEIKAAVKEIDWEKINKELKQVKEMNLDKLDIKLENIDAELKRIKPELEKNLERAKDGIEKAKKELKEYKSFIDGLEEDGLINKKEEYTIKHRNGELIINGKVQPETVYNKYRNFLEKHKTLTIEKSDDDFNIDVD